MDRPTIKPLDKFSPREILQSIASPHVIITFIIAFMLGTMTYGLSLFLPSIINQLGFSPRKTQLLSVGPSVTGFIGQCFQSPLYLKIYSLLVQRLLFLHSLRTATIPGVFQLPSPPSSPSPASLFFWVMLSAWSRCSFPDVMCPLDAEHKFTSYGAFYLITLGLSGTGPVLPAWMANNSEPHYRRATTIALNTIAGNAVCFSVEAVFIFSLFISHF